VIALQALLLLLGLLVAGPLHAATPTHDATTTGAGTKFANDPDGIMTISHTRGASCPNAITIVGLIDTDSTPGTLSSLTANGVSMTLIDTQTFTTGPTYVARLYYALAPPSGAFNVVATYSEVMNANSIRVSTYCNVNQSTPIGTPAKATQNGVTTATVNVSSATGELVVDVVGVRATGINLTVGAGQTQRYNEADSGDYLAGGSEEAGGATVTMSWSYTNSDSYGIVAVPLKPSVDANDGMKKRHKVQF
jgi:hypothetical protein